MQHLTIEKLDPVTQQQFFNSIAFNVGSRFMKKIISQVAAELKAVDEPDDADGGPGELTQLRGPGQEEENNTRVRHELGYEDPVSAEMLAALFNAANDELVNLANGGKWPTPVQLAYLYDREMNQKPGKVTDKILTEKVGLIAANTGRNIDLTDEKLKADLTKLCADELAEKAAFFSARAIALKGTALPRAIEVAHDADKDESFDTQWGNLPSDLRQQLLESFGRALDFRCNALAEGKGKLAGIPAAFRMSEIAILRADEKQFVNSWVKAHQSPVGKTEGADAAKDEARLKRAADAQAA